jgi:hypothetical protein
MSILLHAIVYVFLHNLLNVLVQVYNNLPLYIKDVAKDFKKSEGKLKQFLQIHSFYSLQEYFCYK